MPRPKATHAPRHLAPEAISAKPASRKAQAKSGGLIGKLRNLKTPQKVLLAIAAIVLLAIVAAVIYFCLFLNRVQVNISLPEAQLNELQQELKPVDVAAEPFYVLIIGSDSREAGDAGAGRSDTIMLARVDPLTPQATIISIPRDTEVTLENHGNDKINAAFAYDGPAGIVNAVSDLMGVEISHFVELDFNGVINLVDTVGGITVNLPVDVDLDGVFIPAGEQVLDGAHALIVSRCRTYPLGDFQRVVNQRILVQAVAKKILNSDPTRMPDLVEQLSRCVLTDMPVSDALSLLLSLRGMDAEKMYMATIPAHTNFHDEVSFVAAEQPALSEMMARVDQGLPPIDPALPEENKSQTQTAVVE
jgi:LCP family protein required for cell wall assembly